MTYDVFISYSRKDYVDDSKKPLPGNIIDKLRCAFEKAGITAWIDQEGVYSGDAFAKLIGNAISDSGLFLFVSSKNSNSPDCWSADEIALARNKKKHIIPLWLDDTPYNNDFALYLARLDYVDYATEGDAVIGKLVDSINKKLDEANPSRKIIRQLMRQQKDLCEVIKQKQQERREVIEQLAGLGVKVVDEMDIAVAEGTISDLRKQIEELKSVNEKLQANADKYQAIKVEEERRERERKEEVRKIRKETEKLRRSNTLWFDEAACALRYKNLSYPLVRVVGGTFIMGATKEQEPDAYDTERPAHRVKLSSYYIGQTTVPQWLWMVVMGNNPSCVEGDNLPVENVSWNVCQEFIKKVNLLTKKTFALPTEAQWEFAARGGNKSRGYKYSGSNSLDEVAWYKDNSGSKTHYVGTKKPNELGLYDMSGNVYEWCEDVFSSYSSSLQTNPTGPVWGAGRVYRGGCLFDNARFCRVSDRNYSAPSYSCNNLGLRLALSL